MMRSLSFFPAIGKYEIHEDFRVRNTGSRSIVIWIWWSSIVYLEPVITPLMIRPHGKWNPLKNAQQNPSNFASRLCHFSERRASWNIAISARARRDWISSGRFHEIHLWIFQSTIWNSHSIHLWWSIVPRAWIFIIFWMSIFTIIYDLPDWIIYLISFFSRWDVEGGLIFTAMMNTLDVKFADRIHNIFTQWNSNDLEKVRKKMIKTNKFFLTITQETNTKAYKQIKRLILALELRLQVTSWKVKAALGLNG